MKICKKIIMFLLVFSLLVPTTIILSGSKSLANGNKDYIVITKDKPTYNKVVKEKKEKVKKNKQYKKGLEEANIAVINMTETEATILEQNENIVTVEEDIIVYAQMIDEDENGEEGRIDNWTLDAIRASETDLQGITTKGAGIKIGVMDSGIIVDEKIDVVERVNLVTEEQEITPYFEDITGHGTSVAGILAAKENGTGIEGISQEASIVSIKVFNTENVAPLSRIIEGIQWAKDNGIHILNMSFGTQVNSVALHKILAEAYEEGLLLVGAAGNNGVNIEYPAAYEEVIAVGATDSNSNRAEFSAVGDALELMAPGKGVPTTYLFGGYMALDGTSLAAPHVAGAAALLWAKDPSKSNDFIRQLLVQSANNSKNSNKTEYGNGIIDVKYAFDIYEEFEATYVPGKIEYTEISENDSYIENYDKEFVVGSWSTTDHVNKAENSPNLTKYDKYKGDAGKYRIALISAGATRADVEDDYLVSSQCKALHGGTAHGLYSEQNGVNYVKALLFLYKCSRALLTEPTTITQEQVIKNVATEVMPEVNASNADSNPRVKDLLTLRNAVIKFLSEKNLGLDIKYESKPKTSRAENSYKILGLAIHAAGDTYAHRTIVPTASLTNGTFNITRDFSTGANTCTDSQIKNRVYDYRNSKPGSGVETLAPVQRNWNCFKRGVELQCVEFKDVCLFTKKGRLSGNDLSEDIPEWQPTYSRRGIGEYEDNIQCYPERYEVATKYITDYLMGKYGADSDSITENIFLPGANGRAYNLKLNNLKNFYLDAGFTWKPEWDKYSTTDLK